LHRLVTGDETWVHHLTPETKEQTRQWKHSGSPCPKKAKVVLLAGKFMPSFFWDSKGLLLIDYLPKGQTINGQYYVDLLEKLNIAIREKRPHLAKKKIIFHHDNARPHKCALTTAELAELNYEILPHPPYSPDLAPSYYHLFPKLKKEVGGKRFQSHDDLELFVNGYFEDLPQNQHYEGIAALESRWTKCIELMGDYVEK
jgi:histone-lysine N-methyltransferase SETMAR